MAKFIDLCHRIVDGMITYPEYPGVKIDQYLTRRECAALNGEHADSVIDRVTMLNCTGTYIDSPYHRKEGGYKVAEIPLSKCANLDYEVVMLKPGKECFDEEDLKGVGQKGQAVLLCSGESEKFGREEYGRHPAYLTAGGAKYLMERGVVFVGIDTALIDCMWHNHDWGNPVHDTILEAGAVVCEDMNNLHAAVPYQGKGKLFAAPLKIEMGSISTRAFVLVDEREPGNQEQEEFRDEI